MAAYMGKVLTMGSVLDPHGTISPNRSVPLRVSAVLFVMGLFEFVWGFWGDFVEPTLNPSLSIASRFEIGVIFWVVSFALYIVRKRKTDRELP